MNRRLEWTTDKIVRGQEEEKKKRKEKSVVANIGGGASSLLFGQSLVCLAVGGLDDTKDQTCP